MVELRWTPQAIDDINNIAEYIAKDQALVGVISPTSK